MLHRLAIVFATVLSAAPPAWAQEPAATASTGAGPGSGASTVPPARAREPAAGIEFGGGWYQWNPLGVDDFSVFPSGPSVDLAWTTWRSERRGLRAASAGSSPCTTSLPARWPGCRASANASPRAP